MRRAVAAAAAAAAAAAVLPLLEGLKALKALKGAKALKVLNLDGSQITDAGCAHLASRLRSGALPALLRLDVVGIISASEAAREAVYEARPGLLHG